MNHGVGVLLKLSRFSQVRCHLFFRIPFDLVENLQRKKRKYPILYKVALDIIPVQVSAVPCEPVLSSNKGTDIDRRSNTSGSFKLTEVL